MNKDTVNQILDALASRFAVPASHLWDVLVRQARIEFWQGAGTALLALLAAFGMSVVAGRATANARAYLIQRLGDAIDREYGARALTDRSPEPAEICAWLATSGLALFGAILTAITLASIGDLLNPEYHALKEILGAFK